MRKKRKKLKKLKSSPLASRLQVISKDEGPFDTRDSDVLSYLAPFAKTFREKLPLKPIDLTTKDKALESIKYLDSKLLELEQQRHIAKSLEKLLLEERNKLMNSGELDNKDRNYN